MNGQLAARRKRLDAFPGKGPPPTGVACELLCEDHVGTYELPYACHWADGKWRKIGTNEPIMAGVVAWREEIGA